MEVVSYLKRTFEYIIPGKRYEITLIKVLFIEIVT